MRCLCQKDKPVRTELIIRFQPSLPRIPGHRRTQSSSHPPPDIVQLSHWDWLAEKWKIGRVKWGLSSWRTQNTNSIRVFFTSVISDSKASPKLINNAMAYTLYLKQTPEIWFEHLSLRRKAYVLPINDKFTMSDPNHNPVTFKDMLLL